MAEYKVMSEEEEEEEAKTTNQWIQYRDHTHEYMSASEIRDWAANRANIRYVSPPPGERSIPNFSGYATSRFDPEYSEKRKEFRKDFLEDIIPGLDMKWTGIRLFGTGNSGPVGLWQYTGPEGENPLAYDKVVVKEEYDFNLKKEIRIMKTVNESFSTHIVRLIAQSQENLAFNERRKMIMEYCSQGSLCDLLERRIERKPIVPFDERTLWRIFNCLVDALSVLAFGIEVRYNPSILVAIAKRWRDDWEEIIHCDIKFDNVLLGERDADHYLTPVCKLSDFGLSEYIPKEGFQISDKRVIRESGSMDWFPPENFTERWDYQDWHKSGVAGEFGTKTNIWGVGAMMWGLAMLKQYPPGPRNSFLPSWNIKENPAKGLTYGIELMGNNSYSESLRNLIFECLYERPEHRPDLVQLKRDVNIEWADAQLATNSGDPGGEPWEDFKAPEPTDGRRQQPQPLLLEHPPLGTTPSAEDTAGTRRALEAQREWDRIAQEGEQLQQPSFRGSRERDSGGTRSPSQKHQEHQQDQDRLTQSGAVQAKEAHTQPSRHHSDRRSQQQSSEQSQREKTPSEPEDTILINLKIKMFEENPTIRRRARHRISISPERNLIDLKQRLIDDRCPLPATNMNFQVVKGLPARVILRPLTISLKDFGITDPEVVYVLHLHDHQDPVPEGEVSSGAHVPAGMKVIFKMADGQYAGKIIELRGLSRGYSVAKVKELLEEKSGIPVDSQKWRIPVVHEYDTLWNYALDDGEEIEVWDLRAS